VEDWERTLRVNITAPFLIVRAFGPHMLKQKRGVVINIASGRGVQGAPSGANYACSKAAILSLTKTLALEWASQNVRVNAIIPGVSMTAQPWRTPRRKSSPSAEEKRSRSGASAILTTWPGSPLSWQAPTPLT
jgi:NAD(P)-dependent dehydrogenase (short-subunit alcohol dehydrogenase family)